MGGRYEPEQLANDARDAEASGFDLLSISDHLHTDTPRFEPWTALTWIAAATKRLMVLPNVLAVPYRHPAVLAKMAETLNRLSDGRLVLGMGSGGYDHEFVAFGLAQRSPRKKHAALEEAIQVIRALWTQTSATFEGEHFQVTQARIEPRPTQPIPIWLGTYGPRALHLTGTRADGWLPSLPRLTGDDANAKLQRVRDSCRAASRDPDTLTYACNIVVDFDSRRPPAFGVLTGSDQAVAEQLSAVVDAGFTCPIALVRNADHRERLATEVLPLVRAHHQVQPSSPARLGGVPRDSSVG